MPRSRTFTNQLELAALTAAFVAGLVLLHLPAAFLLGAMAAAMVVVGRGATLRLPEPVFALAQAVVGCLIARNFTPALFHTIVAHAATFALSTFSVLLVATLVGLALARARVLPGSTALWGMFPGGATVMVVLSGSFGGDMRLVAVMQYTRVVVAATAASVIARLAGLSGGAAQGQPWLGPVAWPSFAASAAIILFSGLVIPRWRVPAGALLAPMVVATVLQDVGLLQVELPRVLLVASYVVIGWAVGLRFTREAFVSARRSLPQIIASVVGLVAACAGIGWALARITRIDLLTAYLATSPGGADSIAIIAAGTPIDVAFVMSTQMARVVSVLVLGPQLVKQAAKLAPPAPLPLPLPLKGEN
jgi:membrane AbrB-like protein